MTETKMSTASTADDGKTADGGRKERVRGLGRVRENEFYYLTSLIGNCLDEAGHLVGKVNTKACARFTDYRGDKGSEPLDYAEIGKALCEAHTCALRAASYMEWLESRGSDEPWMEETPF